MEVELGVRDGDVVRFERSHNCAEAVATGLKAIQRLASGKELVIKRGGGKVGKTTEFAGFDK